MTNTKTQENQIPSGPILMSLHDSLKLDTSHTHAAHCLLYSKTPSGLFGLMQMRTDGRLGFPGGGVEVERPEPQDLVEALNREMMEEINYESTIEMTDYLMTHLHKTTKENNKSLVTHFFLKEISAEDMKFIEKEHTKAPYFPEECLGLFRVPVFPTEEKFFANFALMRFAGNAGDQLFQAFDLLRGSEVMLK